MIWYSFSKIRLNPVAIMHQAITQDEGAGFPLMKNPSDTNPFVYLYSILRLFMWIFILSMQKYFYQLEKN